MSTEQQQQQQEQQRLINEIRHLEKSTNDALRSTQDEILTLDSSTAQTQSVIEQLEHELSVKLKLRQEHRQRISNNYGTNRNPFMRRASVAPGFGGGGGFGDTRRESLEDAKRKFNRRPSSLSLIRQQQQHLGLSNHSRLSHQSTALTSHAGRNDDLSGDEISDEEDDELSSSNSSSPSTKHSNSKIDNNSSCNTNNCNSTNKKRGITKEQKQISELRTSIEHKKEQLSQLQQDEHSNSIKLSTLHSQLYILNKQYDQMTNDHTIKMNLLEKVYTKKFKGRSGRQYVSMRCNSVIDARDRLDKWRCIVETLQEEVDRKNKLMMMDSNNNGDDDVDDAGADDDNSESLKSVQDGIRRYEYRIKLHEMYKQKILDSLLLSLENGMIRLDDCKKQMKQQQQQQQQQRGDVHSESAMSSADECPTGGIGGGLNNTEDDEDVEDLSYTIGEEEGLSLRQSVQDSDISETASEEEEVEEEEESDVISPNAKTPVKANTTSSFVQTTTTTTRRHLTVLITKGNFNLTQIANQRSALQLLTDLSLPHVTINGMDPTQRERRNELFDISGIRGNYPQIFVSSQKIISEDRGNRGEGGTVEGESHDEYLGGYEWFESCDLDELKAMLVTSVDSDNYVDHPDDDGRTDTSANDEHKDIVEVHSGEEMDEDQRRIVKEIAADIDGHMRSLEKAIRMIEKRVDDFDILTTTENRQPTDKDTSQIDAANRSSSLAKQCADILENFTTKTSDIISSSIPSIRPSCDDKKEPREYIIHNSSSLLTPSNNEDDIIAEIEERKLHLQQLEQSRDVCNANIEILKSDIKSYELAMEEKSEFSYDLFSEIQTKVRVLSKRLEDGAGEIRDLVDENKYWSSREDLLLKSHHKGDIRFVK